MKKYIAIGMLYAAPFLALAQTGGRTTSLQGALAVIANLINLAIPVLIGAAVLVFMWGLFTYIMNVSDEEKRNEGKMMMIWGIIALFVMFSVFGLVNLLVGTFSLQNTGIPAPQVPQTGPRF